MIKRKNINNKSLLEVAISDCQALDEKDKIMLRNWLDGIVAFVNSQISKSPEAFDIYGEEK